MDINHHWYRSAYTWVTILLLPLSMIFYFILTIRRSLFRLGVRKTHHFPVPVIVVGNITVGGTGKTPFVIWLAQLLQSQGLKPGIVSRGYGGKRRRMPCQVEDHANPALVGDEAVLLKKQTHCPVFVSVNRVAAVRALLAKTDCDVVISDDGLQHYRLGREIEIAIVDGIRRFGNQLLLPAGPLREPVSRLKQVDFIVAQQQAKAGEHLMLLQGDMLVSLMNPDLKKPLAAYKYNKAHVVAAIGNPKRFFSHLRSHGIEVIEHTFPDHYLFKKADIDFGDDLPVIMTEKDAVKCMNFSDERHWYFPVEAKIDEGLGKAIIKKLKRRE